MRIQVRMDRRADGIAEQRNASVDARTNDLSGRPRRANPSGRGRCPCAIRVCLSVSVRLPISVPKAPVIRAPVPVPVPIPVPVPTSIPILKASIDPDIGIDAKPSRFYWRNNSPAQDRFRREALRTGPWPRLVSAERLDFVV